VKEIYLAVAGRIRRELPELNRLVERTLKIWEQAGRASDDYYVDAAALNLHGFYAGLERLLEVIADGIDMTKPAGPNWHQELLRQMASDIPGIRPVVISPELRDRLDRYRGFRHVVRNVYTFSLDPDQVETLVRQLQPVMDLIDSELSAFSEFLQNLANGG
jgi:hypothetical protein